MPLNGRSARAGARSRGGLLFRQWQWGRCPALRLRRGAESRQSRKRKWSISGERSKRRHSAGNNNVRKRDTDMRHARGGPPHERRNTLLSIVACYSIGRLRGFGPRGNARPARRSRSALSVRSPAAAFSAACSAVEAFGIANTEECASGKLSATWRGVAVRIGNRLQHFAVPAVRRREIIVTERRVGDDGDAMPLAPRDHRVLDRTFLQMIEHLIAGDAAIAGDIAQFVEIVGIEIAHAPGADFSGRDQFVERRDGVFQGDRIRANAGDSSRDDRSSAASASARRP